MIFRRRRLIPTLLLLLLLLLPFGCSGEEDNMFRVSRVVDGDTIVVLMGGKEERVRLIGVDTPETKQPRNPVELYGPEASAFTREALEGKKVRLETDVQERDRYGRLLAYVYLEDGTFFNEELLRQGYAKILTVPPNVKYSEEFLNIQRQALEAGRGLWGAAQNVAERNAGMTYLGNSNSKKLHRQDCPLGQRTAQHNRITFTSRKQALAQGFSPCKECKP